MRRGTLFWGVILLVGGVVLLLGNMGVIQGSVWAALWPVMLILLGVWVLLGVTGGTNVEVERLAIPLENSSPVEVIVSHGLGQSTLAGAAASGMLVEGEFTSGVDATYQTVGDTRRLTLSLPHDVFPAVIPFGWGNTLSWDYRLSGEVPLSLRIKGGAGILRADLHALRVRELNLEGSAGSVAITMPATGATQAQVEGGVGEVRVTIPREVAARIQTSTGVGSMRVDQQRFPMIGDHLYQSPGYDNAENRLDLRIEGGVGTVTVG